MAGNGIIHRFIQIRTIVRPDHQNNVGAWRHRMHPFDIEGDLVGGTVIELRRARALVRGDRLRVFERPAVDPGRDAGRRGGLLAAFAMMVGALAWAAAALYGLQALFAQFEWLYVAFRIGGARTGDLFVSNRDVESKGAVTRTVSANVTPTQTITTQGYAVWQGLYEDNLSPPCVSGSTQFTQPILTRGDFCMSGGTVLNSLEVGGNFSSSGCPSAVTL